MPFGDSIRAELPLLRRYARALTGSQAVGDELVRQTLQAAVDDEAVRTEMMRGRVQMYRLFTRTWSHSGSDVAEKADAYGADAIERPLSNLSSLGRQALLLTTMEGFAPDKAAYILDISEDELRNHSTTALDQIASEHVTDVLIIEDEPLILMQLEQLVEDLGHRVVGLAATRDQAVEIVSTQRPGLVLADIQLADGSSGIDAVNDIKALHDVPVIFITAYPEKLLTGDRPEPTYLITKPFKEDAVRIVISQAMLLAGSMDASDIVV